MRRMMFLSVGLTAWALAACGPKPSEAPPTPAPAPAPVAATPAAPPAPEAPAANNGLAPDGYPLRLAANGFSPAWQARFEGDTLQYEVPETSGPDSALRSVKAARSPYATGFYAEGKEGETVIGLDITKGPCDVATEGGAPREFNATLTYGQQTYKGCADAVR